MVVSGYIAFTSNELFLAKRFVRVWRAVA